MKNVMIVCQCATNKGDRAIAEYLIRTLLQRNFSITLSTTEPSLWENVRSEGVEVIGTGYRSLFRKTSNRFLNKVNHEITSFYYDRFVYPEIISSDTPKRCERLSKEYISYLKKADLVIVTGGHHITSIRNKNAMFSITYDIALASLYSKKYILWSQTIGPLSFDNQKIKEFFAGVIRKADAVFIRDNNSRKCLQELVGDQQDNIYKSYDSVFGFGKDEFVPYEKRENKVGISIFNGLKKAFDTYPAIAGLLDFFAQKGNSIEFFRMENDDKELTDIQTIISMMKTKPEIKVFPFKTTTKEHMQELSTCKYYIGYKTHSVIMSLTTATPLLGICYHKKTNDFMKDYRLEEYAIDDEEMTLERGVALAEKIIESADHINEIMTEKSRAIATSIADDFKEVLDEK